MLSSSFPTYDNPTTVGPSVLAAGACCTVRLFDHVGLRSYGQVATSAFEPPHDCPPPWRSVVLEWTGGVAGVQFDRYGALWLSGVEILRLTTPEPDAAGIEWRVDRDLTGYAALFEQPGNASLAIPNVVDSTYTGVLFVSANLSFVSEGAPDTAALGGGSRAQLGLVAPISNPLIPGSSPFDAMGVSGGGNVTGTISFPSRDTTAARIDLYASGHSCEEVSQAASEATNLLPSPCRALALSPSRHNWRRCRSHHRHRCEPRHCATVCQVGFDPAPQQFWYSNVPDNYTAATGACGGGAYRELEIFVDEVLAGAAYPFPVVYSGGVCPLLWRPLAGLYQFNVPPYAFDLAPFLGVLNDGGSHSLTVRVVGNNNAGVWYLDPVLVATRRPGAGPITGGLHSHGRSPPDVQVEVSTVGNSSWTFSTRGQSSYFVEGWMRDAAGHVARHSVRGALRAWNENVLTNVGGGGGGLSTDEGVTNTTGEMQAHVHARSEGAIDARSSGGGADGGDGGELGGELGGGELGGGRVAWQLSESRYPYQVNDTEAQDASSFQLQGAVRMEVHRRERRGSGEEGNTANAMRDPSWSAGSGGGRDLSWSAVVASQATYNRSTDASRAPHVESGQSHATFSSADACFEQRLAALNGSFTTSHIRDECKNSLARRALCEAYDQCMPPPASTARGDARGGVVAVGEQGEHIGTLLRRRRRQHRRV